ncbi:MAG: sulfatase-like hydrolase/transferase [Saprospiraceae bacterium]|nr:sulfatase-like hydrolase/transferase [Saprospiraceae bacterium]
MLIILPLIGCQEPKEDKPPNILMIMADDLGWADVGFNSEGHGVTPHLDHLASTGVIFDRFYAACPVCSPTRASCLTGRSPYRMNIPTANAGHLPLEEVTIPELLQSLGYRTGHFGKWHLGTLTRALHDSNRGGRAQHDAHYSPPNLHGYDEFFCTEAKVPTFDPMARPQVFDTLVGESLRYGWRAVDNMERAKPYGTHYWDGREHPVHHDLEGPNSRVIMDRALEFMGRSIEDEAPFFATIWFHTPHLPVVADERLRSASGASTVAEQLYFGSILALDEQVGRLSSFLGDFAQLENSVIWFCSDNGPEDRTPGSAGPFRERKRSLYEGGVRVPAFLSWPHGLQHHTGSRIEIPAITHDYLPTIAEIVGLEIPGVPLDGISLLPLIQTEATERLSPFGFQFHATKRSWVTDTHKLISTNEGVDYELYDLQHDPKEEQNIIQSRGPLAEKLRAQLEEWMVSCVKSANGEDYP